MLGARVPALACAPNALRGLPPAACPPAPTRRLCLARPLPCPAQDGVLCESEEISRLAATEAFAELYGLTVHPDDFLPFTGRGEANFLGGCWPAGCWVLCWVLGAG